MKTRNFFFAALAAAFTFAACEPVDPNGGGIGDQEQGTPSNPSTPGEPGADDGQGAVSQSGFTGSGDYWITIGDVVAKPISASYTYDYLYVDDAWKNASGAISSSEQNAFTFTAVEDGYTIQDANDKYLYATQRNGSWNKNFNVSESLPESGAVWTVEVAENGECTITNVTSSTYIQYSSAYTSFGHYPSAQDGGVMPKLVSVEIPISLVASLDVNRLVFSSEGETKTVTATEGVSVTAQSDNSAFSVDVNENIVSVTVSETTEAREGTLTVTMTYNGYSVVKTVALSQAAPSSGNEKTVSVTLGKTQTWTAAAHTEYGAGFKLETTDFIIEHYKGTSTSDVLTTNDETRIYVGHVFMVTPKNGGQIKSVKLTTAGGKNGPLVIDDAEYTAENSLLEWTGAVSVFKAVAKVQTRVTQMVVVYE